MIAGSTVYLKEVFSNFNIQFPRSFKRSGVTDKPKSTRKYLFDHIF